MKKDNQLMSLLSIWGILLVVLGHSGFEEKIISKELAYLHSWIYSFHMPLFFLISGYLFSHTNKQFETIQSGKFLWKKVKRLLVPYFVLGTVIYFIKFAFAGLSHASREFSVGEFFFMFMAPNNPNSTLGYLWYVFTLFVIFCVVVAISKCRINLKTVVSNLIIMVAGMLVLHFMPQTDWLNIYAVLCYLPFFLVGILFNQYEERFLRFVKTGGGKTTALLLISTILLTYYPIYLPFGLAYYVRAVVGIWMSMSLCCWMLNHQNVSQFFLPFSKNTYSIYLLSWFSQYATKFIVINVLHLHWSICVISMFVAGVLVPLIIDYLFDKCKILGGNKFLRLTIGY